jgi:hypothetical protein
VILKELVFLLLWFPEVLLKWNRIMFTLHNVYYYSIDTTVAQSLHTFACTTCRSPATISVYTEPLQSLFFLSAIPPYTGQCICCRVPSVLVVFAMCLPAFRGILPMILCLMWLRVLPARMTAWEISSPLPLPPTHFLLILFVFVYCFLCLIAYIWFEA